MSLELINNSFFVTLQDKGRFSYTHLGVTNSGVMDEYSYFIANKLLGNSRLACWLDGVMRTKLLSGGMIRANCVR